MSTQHPDNARVPSFSDGPAFGADAEVKEAYYVYHRLGCEEQMWDHEGKEVDSFVVSKLLANYSDYFHKHPLGKDVRLTLRVPNPSRERGMAKVLLEILESIPRSFDIARHFYKKDLPPIFEVILPMTTSALELNRLWYYYRDFVSGKSNRSVVPGDVSLQKWIGDFLPREINVIPLIEDMESMLRADQIVEEFVRGKPAPYQRVFFARSDPAMTYGSTAAVLLLKIALYRLSLLEQKLGLPLYPIVGLGSAPFRGNFKPTHIKSRLIGYPSVQTFTVQSAFKFDYPEELVRSAIQDLNRVHRKAPIPVQDEPRLLEVIAKMAATYARQVTLLAPLINRVAPHIPSRRKRRLHVGLFGYARSIAGVHLPRAIGFCASLYSLGIPPELLGLSDLTPQELRFIIQHYPNFNDDMTDALQFFDEDAIRMVPPKIASDLKKTLRLIRRKPQTDLIHQALTRAVRSALDKKAESGVSDLITQAALERKFLG